MIRLCARPVMFSPCPAYQQPGVPLVPLMLSFWRAENRLLCFLSAGSLRVHNCTITEHFSHTDDEEHLAPVFQGTFGVCMPYTDTTPHRDTYQMCLCRPASFSIMRQGGNKKGSQNLWFAQVIKGILSKWKGRCPLFRTTAFHKYHFYRLYSISTAWRQLPFRLLTQMQCIIGLLQHYFCYVVNRLRHGKILWQDDTAMPVKIDKICVDKGTKI